MDLNLVVTKPMKNSHFDAASSLAKQIQQDAAHCVKCGLCAPRCPTYLKTQHEAESPRGRIALMEGFASGKLTPTQQLTSHLDHCLTCRACEAICPSEVPYGRLIDNSRALLVESHHSTIAMTRLWRFLNLIIFHPRVLILTSYLLFIYQRMGLQWLIQKTGLLKYFKAVRLNAYLPKLTAIFRSKPYFPSRQQTHQGDVTLFTGCINRLVDQKTLSASIKVLTACGYGIHIPKTQYCCGALHLHAGKSKQAWQLRNNNVQAFSKYHPIAILSLASACSATLKEYPVHAEMHNDSSSAINQFSMRVIDIVQFLNRSTWPKTLRVKPLAAQVAIHIPCSMRNVLHAEREAFTLLSRIPQLEIIPLNTSPNCCGAAGLNMLQHPEMADKLLADSLATLEQIKPSMIATTNIGCSLHLMKGIRERNKSIPVLHPITILAQQLDISE